MKYLFILVTFIFISCECKNTELIPAQTQRDTTAYYSKTKFIIEEKCGSVNHRYFLLRSVSDSRCTEYYGLGTSSLRKEIYYGKNIGDTLYFDYILKSRFFDYKKPVQSIDSSLFYLRQISSLKNELDSIKNLLTQTNYSAYLIQIELQKIHSSKKHSYETNR